MAPSGNQAYPSTAFVLSLIGGIFILLGGLATAAIAAIIGGALFAFFPGGGVLLIGLAVVGILIGLLTIFGAVMLRNRPESAHTWGVLILVFAIISLFTSAGGGFIIGFILALIGGIFAMTWKPPAPAQAAWGQQPMAPPGAPPMSPPPS